MTLTTRKHGALLAVASLLCAVAPVAADYQQGYDYLKAGKYVEAAAEFQALVDQSPEYDFGHYALGLCFLKMKKLPDAEKSFRKALEINTDKFEYYHGLASSLLERGQYREAAKALDPAEGLVTAQTKYAFYSLRGQAFARQKKWAEAIDDLEKARAARSSAPILVQLGKAYYALGHYDKTVPLFEAALKENPNDADTWRLLAESRIKLGKQSTDAASKSRQYEAAVRAAEKYRALEPSAWEATNLVGKAALGAGDFTKASQAFQQVLKMKPDYCFAMINLGKTYIAQEQWDLAETPLQDAARCSPREPTIWESLGLVYQKFGRSEQEAKNDTRALERYRKAIEYYDKAKEIKPTGFIAKAVETINTNIGVIQHNQEQDAIARQQQQEEEAERKRLEEERRKREEWKRKQEGDG